MTVTVDIRRRNRRLALALVGLFALMSLGSVAYIDWVDAGAAPATAAKGQ